MRNLTVGELRKAIEGVDDSVELRLDSDTGIDQGMGSIVIESAKYIKYAPKGSDNVIEYVSIYANDTELEDEEDEED